MLEFHDNSYLKRLEIILYNSDSVQNSSFGMICKYMNAIHVQSNIIVENLIWHFFEENNSHSSLDTLKKYGYASVQRKSISETNLSTFLEVQDPGNSSGDWSFLIVYQVAVINGKMIEKSVVEQSAERCSRATKNHGWSEFMTLTSLFSFSLFFFI
ncbi:hypothetical protein D5086_019701 [Populus alba]|uniref:Uncharacterized protein n=1 Tax=Populus alba TaxID=43335 RepID=A0ACC4BJB5_POPAL